MGENTCMRCGKPCGAGETMCEECQAWFAQKTAGNAGQKKFKKIRIPEQSRGSQFCTKCGKKMPIEAKFCTGCGNPLRGAAQMAEGEKNVENNRKDAAGETGDSGNTGVEQKEPDTGKASGKGAKKILIAVAALVLVAALIFGVRLFLGDKKETGGKQQASSAENAEGNGIGKVAYEESEEEKAAREKAEQEKAKKAEEERLRKEQEEKERAEREAQEKAARELAIHSYEVVVSDCTWEQAYEDCKNRGGYLVRINSAEEYSHIIGMLQNYGKIHFYLGGKRGPQGVDYYWVDNDGAFMGECLNAVDSWTAGGYWFKNEPSFVDTGSGGAGRNIEEAYMNLFCVSGTWYLNDSSGSLAIDYPDLLAGKVGYIVEYE